MVPLRVRLGQAIREIRRAVGFSQEGFAAHIHVHRTSMGAIERGKGNVGLDTLEQVAVGLGMPAWDLLRIAEVAAGSAEPRAESRIDGPSHPETTRPAPRTSW